MSIRARVVVIVLALLLLAALCATVVSAQVVPGPRGNPIVDQKSYARPPANRGGGGHPGYRPAPSHRQGTWRPTPYRHPGGRYPYADRQYRGYRGYGGYYGGRGYRGYRGFGGYYGGLGPYGYGYGYGIPCVRWVPGGLTVDPYTGQLMVLPGLYVSCGAW